MLVHVCSPSLCLGGGNRGSDGELGCGCCFCGQQMYPGGNMVVGVVFWEKLDLWEGCFGVGVFSLFIGGHLLSIFQIRVLCGLIHILR